MALYYLRLSYYLSCLFYILRYVVSTKYIIHMQKITNVILRTISSHSCFSTACSMLHATWQSWMETQKSLKNVIFIAHLHDISTIKTSELRQCKRFVIHLSRSRVKTCLAVAKVRYVVRNTLIYVDSNSPSSVARLSTSFSKVPAFTNRTRTVSHSRCEISSSESCSTTNYQLLTPINDNETLWMTMHKLMTVLTEK